MAEKWLYGDFRFVKWFRHLLRLAQQVGSEIGHLFCLCLLASVAQVVPVRQVWLAQVVPVIGLAGWQG
jgi:hypothetical protein